ncbi:DNA primase subunit pri2 [Coniosporium tulheliwenetii]|uniref:DNA primase subunit pri2 n=1 Tax=Coniosporium tulheliwenetii TaxID=3383036 RepID=A0ACC2Z6W5_9PEZI|nr:DNA primase subunit pri2 [Cladosporium sp. JES 115]
MLASSRIDPKRRNNLDHRKRQFAQPQWQQQKYEYGLNFYVLPPTAEITLEEFEEWAIARLKVLSELESCTFRNRTLEETTNYMTPILQKHMPLNPSRSSTAQDERKKDHYSHFILRLAFSATEDLRRRFSRLETMLFRLRYKEEDARERKNFVDSLGATMGMSWEKVSEEEEVQELGADLRAATGYAKKGEDEGWFKVDWEKVPELVESRRVLLKRGKAYVPVREQQSLVVAEFGRRLDAALEVSWFFYPVSLDDRDVMLMAPGTAYSTRPPSTRRRRPPLPHPRPPFPILHRPRSNLRRRVLPSGLAPTHQNIDALSQHFPLCMQHLHRTLRQNSHLKHYGRLQYTLFLKGIGLSLEECILFWRRSFKLMTDEKFTKEYKYNIRHAYGDVGGDANRRGRGYTPYSCQKLLTEALPGPGQTHGCPYRTFTVDNLAAMLQQTGVSDRETLKCVREDVARQRYHIACNRVFEYAHKTEIKEVKNKGVWGEAELDTILHPNTYFKRSFLLKHLGEEGHSGE